MQRQRLAKTLSVCSIALLACSTLRGLPQDPDMVLGCWAVETGRFSVTAVPKATHVDPGQTATPSMIELDSVRGRSWNADPVGRRVRAFGNPASQYRDGYYHPSGNDGLRIVWSNGFTSMAFEVRLDSLVMRGHAEAMTEDGGVTELQRALLT
jgi:hypothetical protein